MALGTKMGCLKMMYPRLKGSPIGNTGRSFEAALIFGLIRGSPETSTGKHIL